MIFRINSNIASINAQRNLMQSGRALNKSLEKLSSGLRINRAADDAAGLAVAERLSSELTGLRQASRNSAQATTLVQSAEGGYDEIGNILNRLKELAVQASDDSLTDTDRDAIEVEVAQQLSEIDRIADSTTFNGTALITGGTSGTAFTFQVGAGGTNDQIAITIKGANTNALASLSNIVSADFGTAASASAAIDTIDNAITSLNLNGADIGAFQNRLEGVSSNLSTMIENTEAAESVIRDVDIAAEVANMTRAQILVQAGVSMLGQANITPQNALALLP